MFEERNDSFKNRQPELSIKTKTGNESYYINDDETIKENLNWDINNFSMAKYICMTCTKTFSSITSYQKHKKLYPDNHKYPKCCDKVEEIENIHQCSLTNNNDCSPLKINTPCAKLKMDTENEEDSQDDNFDEDESQDGNFDEEKSKNTEENEFFSKRKRPQRKKPLSEKLEEEINKIFKCQECSKLFDKYSSLKEHIKYIHKKQGNFKCEICDEQFDTDEDYESHCAMHGPEDKVVCKGCRRMFDSLKSYYIHAKQNPGVHCFLCKLCLRKFPTELMLEQHVCICQNGKPLHCACGQQFTKYDDVIKHSKGTKPFYCCSCSHLCNSLTAYIRHLRKHSKQKPYQCTKCDMKFAVIDFLNIHNKKYHSEGASEPLRKPTVEIPERHVCTICDEVFLTEEELKNHGLQHERVQCPDCGKLLKRNRLENHRNTHKTSASLCPECGKLFDTRFKLTQHLITTHNNEPVKCEVCMKVLKTKKILNEHMKTHLKSEVGGRIPQAICPMCGLGLAQKGSLARHILLTHEKHKIIFHDKTYTCQECSAVLPSRAKYYSHRRMHRAMVDRFPCEVCGREFNKKQNLRRHMYLLHDEKRVIGEPIFKCQICTRCFREKKNLKRHYKMVHKLEDVT